MRDPASRTATLSLLMVGPLPPPIGGTRISFELLVKALTAKEDLRLEVIPDPPTRNQPLLSLVGFVRRLLETYKRAGEVDAVVLHCNVSGLDLKGIPFGLIAKAKGKPLIVRTFGGEDFREQYGPLRRVLMRKVLRSADLYLAQTRVLVERAQKDGIEPVEWFPTSRPPWKDPQRDSAVCRRFVFMSHVTPSKGVRELIQAGERFGEEVSIDVYGPCRGGLSSDDFVDLKRVRYRGEVAPEKVLETLTGYDALLLPTYHEGEGYPGVVIEAFQVGLPIICTNWQALPELVDDTCGLLVEPRNAEALHTAMENLVENNGLFLKLREGSRAKGPEFSTELWTEKFVEYCWKTVAK